MAQTLVKKEDDVVNLVNKSKSACIFKFNSNDYTVPAGATVMVKRHLADHAIGKCRIVNEKGVYYPLSIEEVDNPRMDDNDVNLMRINEIKILKDEIALGEDRIAELEKENKELLSKNEHLEKRLKAK